MLPFPTRSELRHRLPRLVLGLLLFGVGMASMVAARLGLPPWSVLHEGLSFRTGIPIGTMGIIVGLLVLLLWIPLGERFGVGTVLNVVIVGVTIDLTLWLLPTLETPTVRWSFLFGGLLLVGIGSGLYIGAGLGPGPRDGLMTGLAKRGPSLRLVRTGIELTVLALGWLLGGTVGIGTVLFSLGVGPLVQHFLGRFRIDRPVTGVVSA